MVADADGSLSSSLAYVLFQLLEHYFGLIYYMVTSLYVDFLLTYWLGYITLEAVVCKDIQCFCGFR